MIHVRVQPEDFDPAIELAALTQGRHDIGGVASFIGLVRADNKDGAILSMTLEHYPGMTERQLTRIAHDAAHRWPVLGIRIVHRYGKLHPGERIVLTAVASAHRAAALQACEFLIDWLKTHAPFWKLEEGAQGDHWVAARPEDDDALKKWT